MAFMLNAATAIILTSTSTEVEAGEDIPVTLTAVDASGQRDKTFFGTLSLDDSGSVMSPQDIELQVGQATVLLRSLQATTVTVSVSDQQATGLDVSAAQLQLTWYPGPIDTITLSTLPSQAVVDTAQSLRVEGKDYLGNTVEDAFTVKIITNSTSAALPKQRLITVGNGEADVPFSSTVAETVQVLILANQTIQGNTVQTITFQAGQKHKLARTHTHTHTHTNLVHLWRGRTSVLDECCLGGGESNACVVGFLVNHGASFIANSSGCTCNLRLQVPRSSWSLMT